MVLLQLLSTLFVATKLSAFGRLPGSNNLNIPFNCNICSIHISDPQNRKLYASEQTILIGRNHEVIVRPTYPWFEVPTFELLRILMRGSQSFQVLRNVVYRSLNDKPSHSGKQKILYSIRVRARMTARKWHCMKLISQT